MQILASHSSLCAQEAFDETFFLETNGISQQSLNGISGHAYFQVHYHILNQEARYDFSIYHCRLLRLMTLGKCRSRILSIRAKETARSEAATKLYYYPPLSSSLIGMGLRAREADLFLSPETFTNVLAELLVNGEGILACDQFIQMLPSLIKTEPSYKTNFWDDKLVEDLLMLQQEKERSFALTIQLPHLLGRPTEIDDDQIFTLKCCFDSTYYERHYLPLIPALRHLESAEEPEEKNAFDSFISIGRLNDHSPCEFFDYSYYINRYWQSIPSGEDAYHYYLTKGWRQGHDPCRRFSHRYLEKLTQSIQGEEIHGPVGKILKGNYPTSVMLNDMTNKLSPPMSSYYANCELDPAGKEKVNALINTAPSIHAFYLTQYHPISENDTNWGKGFTEWTNTTKTIPYYLGHHQPKLPLEGFYDLRIPENLYHQSCIAKEYGIDSFCFYFYWFQGRRVLEQPLDSFLADSRSQQTFSLLWANENWTRNWDGQNNEIIISQGYNDDDCVRFCEDIIPYLTHSRYYCFDGKPVFYIYRPSSIPDAYDWIARIKKYFKEREGRELIIGIIQYLPQDKLPKLYGADLILQFPPNGFAGMALTAPPPKLQRETADDYLILSYQSMVDENQSLEYPDQVVRTAFPAWDSSPRKKVGWATFTGANPDTFQAWLTNNLKSTSFDNKLNLTMINAWNEWAEGACLEPDRLYGYEYLNAVRDARLHHALDEQCINWSRIHSKAIVAHIFYDEAVERVAKRLNQYTNCCDIYITTTPKGLSVRVAKIFAILPHARILITENRGRDVRPFLEILNTLKDLGIEYDYICKIHGKISHHRQDGVDWFDDVIEKLLPSQPQSRERLLTFLDSQPANLFGLFAPSGHIINFDEYLGGNQIWINMLQSYFAFGKSVNSPSSFIAGTMFWAGKSICSKLVNHFTVDLFGEERGQLDETLAHGYERIFLWYAHYLGLKSYCSDYSILDKNVSGEIRYRYC